ncbi:cellulose biosynthesis cyclic di-GMP-binding regulatory protein BcsB [Rhizobium helianthi]|uniref:Cyclic di-GMP-binding protein n=1 Tax=Rhizobium helianthi TaxID=1132695 RepID=A0ABW4M9J4_9HYPH
MKRARAFPAIVALAWLLTALSGLSDPLLAAPFDMTPETPDTAPAIPNLGSPALPPQQQLRPLSAPSQAQVPAGRGDTGRRYLVPSNELMLAGEFARSVWTVYLTEQEVNQPAKLSFAYRNAVVIAPEASRLFIFLNGRKLAEEPVGAADAARQVTTDVPRGMLQAGANRIEIRVDQRHRTDCDIRSTYDLWTVIEPAETYLSFEGKPAANPSVAEAVRAIGVDADGNTRFHVVVPSLGQPAAVAPLMRLTQGLSLLAGMPNQTITYSAAGIGEPSAGKLAILVGTASELQPIFPSLPPLAQRSGVAVLVPDPGLGQDILLVSGPAWSDISAAIEGLIAPLDRAADVRRDVINMQRWAAPDAPLLFGGERLPLSQLGVDTIEFPGRRVRTAFNIAVPADFYANAYGEAQLLLDAAFANTVLPGSHVDVYVNGNIASTVPINSTKGGIFRHLPIKVALRHIRPGVNTVELEAVIFTKEDAVCAPGATASSEPRLAIFNTTEWLMPKFARISQIPNLLALSGTALPYARADEPLMLSLERFDAETLGAASTFMGKLALMAGQPIATDLLASASAIGERNTIFFGSISQMPPKLLTQINLSPDIATQWRPSSDAPAQTAETSQAFEKWRSRVSGGIWSGQVSALQEWLRRNFDISLSSLRFIPVTDTPFSPTPNQSLLVAQGASPQGRASWTVVTAPTSTELEEGLTFLSQQHRWQQIGGRATAFAVKTDEAQVVPAVHSEFVQTGPRSLGNYRLVLANWLSTNVLFYAILLVVLTVLFGLLTASVLRRLGRDE